MNFDGGADDFSFKRGRIHEGSLPPRQAPDVTDGLTKESFFFLFFPIFLVFLPRP